jgi:hypothetical protein
MGRPLGESQRKLSQETGFSYAKASELEVKPGLVTPQEEGVACARPPRSPLLTLTQLHLTFPFYFRIQEQFQRNPDSYNGAVRENYAWSQDYTDLEVRVPVPKHVVKGKQVTAGTRASLQPV